ncbi:MAG TPA: type II secretion system secretin GspD [Kofleriaceae bacterium]|jgi:general secretion pathway protein D
MNTRSFTIRPLAALLVTTVLSSLTLAPVAFAQPAKDTKDTKDTSKPAEAGSASATPSEDDQLYSCKKRSGGTVAVTFKPETELKDLITWVMGFTCKNFILDPRIVSTGKKFTLIAPNKVSTAEAYNMFLVALSTMGLTVVPKGSTMRIVESSAAKSETVPIYKKGVPANQDQIIRYVLRPTYTQVETLRTALDGIRSTAGSVTAAGSMLIITDYASQVRDMMTLARAIDVPGNNDGIYTIAVKHADATQLAQKINEILGLSAQGATAGAAGAQGGANVGKRPAAAGGGAPAGTPSSDDVSSSVPSKILVDDRTNTLIVVASEAGYLRVKSLVERLDITLDNESGSSIRVYPLENALAEELATTLNNALGQGQAGAGARTGQPGAAGARPPGQPAPPPSGIGDLGQSLEGTVRVIGDKPTNSLIIMSSGRDYLAVKDVIKRLDQPRRQVFIEALVLEVNLDDNLTLGTSFHGGLPFNDSDLIVGGVQSASLKSLNVASLASLTGLIGGAIGSPLANSDTLLGTSIPSYGILVQALATQTNSNVLSTPHIIAIDNEKAEFSVGNNIPYKAGLSFGGFGLPTGGAAGASGLAGSVGQNIQREKLNLTLNITPHISSNDAVRLEVEQETKDLGSNDPELGPTWTERKLKTQVVVSDQATVVIGGLIQEKDIYGVSKVPLLGDIPILGYLFKYSTRQKHKTNLLILLTPYIVKDQTDLQAIRERKVREREEFVHSFTNLNEMKYEPRIDYRRKRGMVEEINRSVLSVEQDAEVLKALSNRKGIIEGAIEYGPSGIDDPADQPKQPAPAPEIEMEEKPAPKKTTPAKKATPKATTTAPAKKAAE